MSKSQIGGQIKTRVDELIRLIETRSGISSQDAARELNVEQDMVESWARFLEKTGDIRIVYKGLTPTFVAVETQTAQPIDEPKASKSVNHPLKPIYEAITGQMSQISDAIGARAYEKIKPAVTALKDQIGKIRQHLADASIEEKDRAALEASIERVTERIDSVENHAQAKKGMRLKSETNKLKGDINTLRKQLETVKPVAPLVPEQRVDQDAPVPVPEGSFDQRIAELEDEAREAVLIGDLERAESVYAQIRELYDETLPHSYEQMRSKLKDHIYTLKKDITFATDEHQKRQIAETIGRITNRIDDYDSALSRGSWDELEAIEKDIIESYNSLPGGLEQEKLHIEERFGSLIVTAAQNRRSALNDQLNATVREMDAERSRLDLALSSSDITAAYESYRSLRALFDQVPAQLVIERIELQGNLLEDYRRLSEVFKEHFITQNEKRIENCTHLIEQIKDTVDTDIPAAQSAYDQAMHELERIDHNYFEQRSRIQYDLMRVHKQLLDQSASTAEQTFEDVVSRFQRKLQDGRDHLAQGEPELAERIYLELLELYRTLPRGHEERKRALREQVFDYYKSLTTSSSPAATHASLNEILERFVAIHHALNCGDPTVLVGDLKRVEQLIDPLPDSVRKHNPMLDRELVRLLHLRRIYEGIIDANERIERGEDPARIASFIADSEQWLDSESVSAAAVAVMLRALKGRHAEHAARHDRMRTVRRVFPEKTPIIADRAPAGAEHQLPQGGSEHVADLKTRIDSIKSLLQE